MTSLCSAHPQEGRRGGEKGENSTYSYLDFQEKESIVFLCDTRRANRKKRALDQR